MKNKLKHIMGVVGLTTTTIGLFGFDTHKDIEEDGKADFNNISYLSYFNSSELLINKYNLKSVNSTTSNNEEVISEDEQIKILLAEVDAERDRIKREELAEIRKQEEEKRKLEEANKAEEIKKKEVEKKKAESDKGNWRTFEATYYSAFCKTCSGTGKTASGVSVAKSIYYKGYRVIATNQNEIPMWSIVEIKTHYGTFEAVALDTGGFGAGGIDVLVDSTKTAYKLGRHDVQVRIIGKMSKGN